jgi:hypothetical protein
MIKPDRKDAPEEDPRAIILTPEQLKAYEELEEWVFNHVQPHEQEELHDILNRLNL